MLDFLISSLRHSSCSSFSSRSFLHINALSLFIVSNDKIEAAWASTLASSLLFSSRILIFSSCALFKRFSSSRDLFKAIMNAFFSSSSLLMQRVCSFSSLVACSSSWLKLATVFFSRSSSESNLSELLFASASATLKSELWFSAFSSSWVSLETFFFSHSSSASNSSDVFVACSNATVTSAWVKLSDSASFSLFSNIFVFSTASAVTAAIWLSLCAKAAPNFSFCKLSFSIRLRTSLISRDSRVSSYRVVVGDDGSSTPSLPSASCSWIVTSVRSWRSCLLSSWISRLEFSASSSFAFKDPFSSKTATTYWKTYWRFASPCWVPSDCCADFLTTDSSIRACKSKAWSLSSLSWSRMELLSIFVSSNLSVRNCLSPSSFSTFSFRSEISWDFAAIWSPRSFSFSSNWLTWTNNLSFSSSASSKSSSAVSSFPWTPFSVLVRVSISSLNFFVVSWNSCLDFLSSSSCTVFWVSDSAKVSWKALYSLICFSSLALRSSFSFFIPFTKPSRCSFSFVTCFKLFSISASSYDFPWSCSSSESICSKSRATSMVRVSLSHAVLSFSSAISLYLFSRLFFSSASCSPCLEVSSMRSFSLASSSLAISSSVSISLFSLIINSCCFSKFSFSDEMESNQPFSCSISSTLRSRSSSSSFFSAHTLL